MHFCEEIYVFPRKETFLDQRTTILIYLVSSSSFLSNELMQVCRDLPCARKGLELTQVRYSRSWSLFPAAGNLSPSSPP
jgi:hypothetical protein